MGIEEKMIERLSFIKYLVTLGTEKSKEPEPFCWVSILHFHDAVELFLELSAEKLGVSKGVKQLHFGEYWNNINPILQLNGKNELTQRIQIEKLNGIRVALKHHGTPPSSSAIDEAKYYVFAFMVENTATVFGTNFDEISLIDMVGCEKTRKTLSIAKQLLKDGKKEDAMDKVAIAFEELIHDYEDRKRDSYGRSPFFFGQDMTFYYNEITDRTITNAIADLQHAVKIISLGLDYRKYSHFKLLTARAVSLRGESDAYIQRLPRRTEDPSEEDFSFCFDFIIQSAIILKEFDIDIRPRPKRSLVDVFG
ncbi:MAG: hypothetical protein NWE92_12430 [Candidatus Bathyarchaeota archaeon]|nr:hypothetical protein [Candidatus Bathyarchaeota archaeon]